MPRQATNDTALNLLRNVPVIRWIWRGGTTGRSRPWWITGPLSRSNHINQGGRVLGQPPYTHLPPPSTFPGHSVMNSPASARRQVCITIKSVNLNVLFGEIYWLFSYSPPGFFSFLFPLRQFLLCYKEKLEVLKKCAAASQVAIYVPLQRWQTIWCKTQPGSGQFELLQQQKDSKLLAFGTLIHLKQDYSCSC